MVLFFVMYEVVKGILVVVSIIIKVPMACTSKILFVKSLLLWYLIFFVNKYNNKSLSMLIKDIGYSTILMSITSWSFHVPDSSMSTSNM